MSLSSRIIVFASVFFSLISQAEEFPFDLSDYIVRVTSEADDVSAPYQGSGIVFSHQGEFYVVTAEHILIPPSIETRPRFTLSIQGQQNQLELLSLDWGHGLALLKIKLPHAFDLEKIPSLERLKQQRVRRQQGENVLAAGYPHGLNSISLDSDAVLHNPRAVLPRQIQIPYFLEAQGAQTERGMSGGALLSEDLEPLGLLEARSDANNTTLAIPMPIITRWIDQQFATQFKTTYTRFSQFYRGRFLRDLIGTGSFLVEIRYDFDTQTLRHQNGQTGYQISYDPNMNYTQMTLQHPFFDQVPNAFPLKPEEQGKQVELLRPRRDAFGESALRSSSYRTPQDGRRWFVGLGFRQKGISHIDPDQVRRPNNFFAFFRLLQHPDATFLAEYKEFSLHYPTQGSNVTSDVFYRNRSYSARTMGFYAHWLRESFGLKESTKHGTPWYGINLYTSRPFDFINRQIEETLEQISNSAMGNDLKEKMNSLLESLLGIFLAEDSERITRQRYLRVGEFYGDRPIHYLSTVELESAVTQKFCQELLSEQKDPAVEKYRETLSEVLKMIKGRQF